MQNFDLFLKLQVNDHSYVCKQQYHFKFDL